LDEVVEVGAGVCEVVLGCVWEGERCSGGSGHVFWFCWKCDVYVGEWYTNVDMWQEDVTPSSAKLCQGGDNETILEECQCNILLHHKSVPLIR
jgi:hypothetical protein